MPYPKVDKGTEICVTVEKGGVFFYGNKQAFRSLARWAASIAQSDPDEHHECHLAFHIGRPLARRKNVWFLFDRETRDVFRKRSRRDSGFDLTFMIVEPKDLKRLRRLKRSGLVPKGWRDLTSK